MVPVYNAADSTGIKKSIEIVDLTNGHFEVVLSDPGLEDALSWTSGNLLIYARRERVAPRVTWAYGAWCSTQLRGGHSVPARSLRADVDGPPA